MFLYIKIQTLIFELIKVSQIRKIALKKQNPNPRGSGRRVQRLNHCSGVAAMSQPATEGNVRQEGSRVRGEGALLV